MKKAKKIFIFIVVTVLFLSTFFYFFEINWRTSNRATNTTKIIPPDWNIWFIDDALDLLRASMWEGGQQGANMVSAAMCGVADGELLYLYMRLYEKLPEAEKNKLYQEQKQWMKDRDIAAKHAAGSEKGGSVEPYTHSITIIDLTEKRIKKFKERLSKYEKNEDELYKKEDSDKYILDFKATEVYEGGGGRAARQYGKYELTKEK